MLVIQTKKGSHNLKLRKDVFGHNTSILKSLRDSIVIQDKTSTDITTYGKHGTFLC